MSSELKRFFIDSKHIILYAFFLAIMVLTLKWLQWKFLISEQSLEIYIGLIAVFFTALGIWVATQLTKTKVQTVIVEKEILVQVPSPQQLDEKALEQLNLSKREYEVLQLLAQGNSNNDIANQLFLSLSTVKTHVSNLLLKMDVKSRTQVIEKAQKLRIIP